MVDSRTPSPDRLFDLSGRVAVVTGATGVLGGAMARGLARAGARPGLSRPRIKRLRLTVLFGLVIFCVLITLAYLLGLLS